jgi:hypothetical protein
MDMAITASDSLVLFSFDRIRNPPVALETCPEGYEKEGKKLKFSALILKQFGLGRMKTNCKKAVNPVTMMKKSASSTAELNSFFDLKYA